MYIKQHTLKGEIRLEGTGLHTGASGYVVLKPADVNQGFQFMRSDLPGSPRIPADVDYVSDLQRSTTLAAGEASVQTVEHLLAALAGLQLDNVTIEVQGPEIPILDGSARPFIEAMQEVGIVEQPEDRAFFVIEEPVHYHDARQHIDLAALPFEDYRVSVMVEYNSPTLGVQHATMLSLDEFAEGIAPNRTFCFLHELELLVNAGLIKGGNLDNAIVLVDKVLPEASMQKLANHFGLELPISTEMGKLLGDRSLLHANEPARHKLLDLIGDLALVGAPIKGQIVAMRPGHAANTAFAKQLKAIIKQKKIIKKYQKTEANRKLVFDIHAIQRILPHRYPFLLIDRITHFNENSIEGYKNITINEPFFQGHFEGNPIMPGVLQLEAMAQVGGVLLLNIIDNPSDHWVYFLAIDKARFKKPVLPGDKLEFKLELLNLKRNICKMFGRAFVDDALVCEAELVASLVKKD
jgi:UDP-3-O-[3-hydroxymyristoyl] N-acetylglucosamine deacetylase/3-hydroxyacyl-[acyl-carrier-protein] dehydratase